MSMQYQGGCSLAGLAIALTSANLKLTRNPIIPELVWGGGWKVNFASGHFEPGCTINFPLFSAYGSAIKSKAMGASTRHNAFTTTLDNGGVSASFLEGKVESFRFGADALSNSPVECSLGIVARDATSTSGGSNTFSVANNDGSTPIPAYNVDASSSLAASNLVTAVDLNVNNNPFRLYTLNGDFRAQSIQLGLMVVTGTLTYYTGGTGGNKSTPTSGNLNISCPGLAMDIANFLITDIADDITGPNNKPMRVISWEAIGTSSNPPVT